MTEKYCKKQQRIVKDLHHKKKLFFLSIYKMVDISADTWIKADVSVIEIIENDNVNKTVLLLLCISDAKKGWGG